MKNNQKVIHFIARAISMVFHPFILPTLGIILLYHSNSYFQLIPYPYRLAILMTFCLSTLLVPALVVAIMSFNKNIDISFRETKSRRFPLLFTAVSYFAGYMMLAHIPASGIFRIFLLGAIIILIALLTISYWWKISLHLATIGGLLGGFIALALRLNFNPWLSITSLIFVAGALGFSRMFLEEHTPKQIYAGFSLAFLIEFLLITFI